MKFFQRHEEDVPETTRLERVVKERDYYHSEVAITPDGTRIVSGSSGRKSGRTTILVQDLLTGRIEHRLEGHTNWARYVAVTPDGAHVVSSSADGTVRIWDLASGQSERTIAVADPAKEGGQSLTVAMTPDGTRVVCSYTGTRSDVPSHYPRGMSVWDLASGSHVRALGVPDDDAYYLVVTPDGTQVISDDGATINVWNLASGELVRKLEGHKGSIFALAVTPDGSHLVSSAEDQTVRVWHLASGSLVRTLKVPGDDHVNHLVVTPDGRRVVSGGGKMVRVWRLDSGRLECALQGSVWPKGQEYSESIHGVAVTPDGKRFVTSDFLAIRVWILSPIETTESFADKVRRIRVGMTEKELTALIGQPRYVGSGAAAFALFPQMIGSVPDDVLESEPWIFDSDFGEFQVVLRQGRVVDTEAGGFGVNGLLRRLAAGNTAVSKPDDRGSKPTASAKTAAKNSEIAGHWLVVGSSVEFEISFPKGKLIVSGKDADDGEELEVREPKWDGETLSLTLVVPTSRWTNTFHMAPANDHTMRGTYEGSGGRGAETWKRKGQLYTPD